MFSQEYVKNSVHRGGGASASAHAGILGCWDTPWAFTLPQAATPPSACTPPGQVSRYTPGGTPPWAGTSPAVHPLGRYTTPGQVTPSQVHPPHHRQVHPPGRSLQRTVRILLECFLVTRKFKQPDQQISKFETLHIHPCPYKQIDFFAHCIIVPMTT